MTVTVSMLVAVTVNVAMTVAMMRMRMSSVATTRRNAGLSFQFLNATGVEGPRVQPGGLKASMGECLEHGLQVLLGALGRAGECDDDGLVPDPSHWPGHHGNYFRLAILNQSSTSEN